MYLHFVSLFIRTATLALLIYLALAPLAVSQHRSQGRNDSVSVVESRLPSFYVMGDWESIPTQPSRSSPGQPVAYAVERLCRYYGVDFDPQSTLVASRSPLEWPRILARDVPDAQRQRLEIRALMKSNGLRFREIIPLDMRPSALADSLANAVAAGFPVLLNTPEAAIVYGYDRRELDHWWWIDRAGTSEIVLESERTVRFTLWNDNAVAGTAWLIEGVEDLLPATDPDSVAWSILETTVNAIQGVPAEGIMAYPLTLRNVRDLLAGADSLPPLTDPMDEDDPFGILRAKVAREQFIEILETAAQGASDSAQIEHLRLVQYHMHGAVELLAKLATALYSGPDTLPPYARLQTNWGGIRARRQALDMATNMLKSERFASESLAAAVTIYREAKATQKSSAPKRRGR